MTIADLHAWMSNHLWLVLAATLALSILFRVCDDLRVQAAFYCGVLALLLWLNPTMALAAGLIAQTFAFITVTVGEDYVVRERENAIGYFALLWVLSPTSTTMAGLVVGGLVVLVLNIALSTTIWHLAKRGET